MTSVIPDYVDLGEHKYGIRSDGFLSAFMSFCMKTRGVIGHDILMAVIGKLGYVPNEVQSTVVLNVINGSISLLPCALYVIMAVLLVVFYDLDNKKHEFVVKEMDKLR